jgi:hypothetical protein
MNPVRRAVDVVGKAALAAGALAGAAYLGSKYLGKEDKEEEELLVTPPKSPEKTTPTVSQAVVAPAAQSVTPADLFIEGIGKKETFSGHPSFIEESVRGRAQMFLERMGVGKLELDNEPAIGSTIVEAAPDLNSQVAKNSGDVTQSPTSDNYNQDVVLNQTEEAQQLRGTNPQKPTTVPSEAKPATQNEVITSSQTFSPGNEAEQLIGQGSAQAEEAFRKSAAYALMKKNYPGLQDIESPTDPASYETASPTQAAETQTPPILMTGVQPSPQMRVAKNVATVEESPIAAMSTPAPVDVGAALRNKGLSLSSDESGVRVVGKHGNEFYLNHPYSSHPKAGIRQTALQEEQTARALLASAGVSPEQAKDYWSTKINALQTGFEPTQQVTTPATAPVTAAVGPASGPTLKEIQELDQQLALTHGARASVSQRQMMRDQILKDRYTQGTGVAVSAPTEQQNVIETVSPGPYRVAEKAEQQDVVPVKQKLFQKAVERPAATTRGTLEHALAEAEEQREGMRDAPAGTIIHNIPTATRSGTRQVKLYPNQQVGVVYSHDPHTEYGYKSDPRYYEELKSMLEQGGFHPGGTAFITAGRNLGLLS